MNVNQIVVSGQISRISDKLKDKNLTSFEIAIDKKDINGFSKKSFFSSIIDNNVLENYKDNLKIGNNVVVIGIPNSYFDNEGQKRFSIKALRILKFKDYLKEISNSLTIDYDKDGTLLWNGKRCESHTNEKEEKELKKLISGYVNKTNKNDHERSFNGVEEILDHFYDEKGGEIECLIK